MNLALLLLPVRLVSWLGAVLGVLYMYEGLCRVYSDTWLVVLHFLIVAS